MKLWLLFNLSVLVSTTKFHSPLFIQGWRQMVEHIFLSNSRHLYLEFFSCCFSPLHQNYMWQLPKYDETRFALINSMWPFDTQLLHGIPLCENMNLCITFPLQGNASEREGTMVRLYEWPVSGWYMFGYVLIFQSVIGLCCFHWMNVNTTHLLFSHTHSWNIRTFFSAHE